MNLDDPIRRARSAAQLVAVEYSDVLQVDLLTSQFGLILSRIRARKDAPPGTGTAFMEKLCEIADFYGVMLLGSPGELTQFGNATKRWKNTTSVNRLKRFYRRFGFVSKSGRYTYRPELPESMYRAPKGKRQLNPTPKGGDLSLNRSSK